MKFKIHDSKTIKRTRYELLENEQGKFIIAKIVGKKVDFMYPARTSENGKAIFLRVIEGVIK